MRGLLVLLLAAASSDAAAALLPRKILAIYRAERITGDHKDIFYHPLHRYAEMPLNHLGMELVYRDIKKGLPDPASLSEYRGVLTWFEQSDDVPDPAAYCAWLEAASRRGLRIVVMGNPGLYNDKTYGSGKLPASCRKAFARIGVRLGGIAEISPLFATVRPVNGNRVELERKLDILEFPSYRVVRAENAVPYLRIGSEDFDASLSEPVAISKRGGVALDPFVLYSNERLAHEKKQRAETKLYDNSRLGEERFRWRIDPFFFFEKSFGLEGRPKPDVTTRNGRRLFFTHVDGDGFFNVSEVDKKSWSAKVFLSRVLEARPKTPFTVSVITGYYDLPRYAKRNALELTRKILALDNVEAASHGHAHPLVWHKGAVALKIPGYRFDPRRETLGSLDIINKRLLSQGKQARLMQWTGNCLPDAGTLRLLEDRGILNINGGDTKFDFRFPTLTAVSPLGRSLPGGRQIYTAASNENIYTNEWEGPYYGFREVVETFERTESPRRLKPVNIYVHFYIAEKIAALKTLQASLAWAHEQALFPAFASDYARLVRGFFESRIHKESARAYRLENASRVRTLRFDAERRFPDLAASRGVLGYKREGSVLYVHLDGSESKRVALTASKPRRPHLRSANAEISDLRSAGRSLLFVEQGWWDAEIVLGGMRPGRRYYAKAGDVSVTARAAADGTLSLPLPRARRGEPRSVRVTLIDTGGAG
jgi:hypothetical protein